MAKEIKKQIKKLKDIQSGKVFNQVALTIHQQIKKRIFTKGKNANDSKIGKYSESTLRIRKSPKNRGRVPQSDFIILQFTGQMIRDFIPIKSRGVVVGSGFKQKINVNKVKWIHDRLNQKIFKLTKKEEKLFVDLLQKNINRFLNGTT